MKNMKEFYKYRISAIICLIVSICLFVVFFISNNNERNRFLNFNRSTIPDDDLEQINSPTVLTLSFNKYYHVDTIQWKDKYGKQVLKIPTISYYRDSANYSNVIVYKYGMVSPYHWPLDKKQYAIIHAMEVLAYCNFSSYKKQTSTNVTPFDYLEKGLPHIFYEKVFRPLLRNIFNLTLYVRTSSPESIIKAISINRVGTITSVHLYNGEALSFVNSQNKFQKPKTNEELYQTSIDEESKKDLISYYKYRLCINSLNDYSQEAETLANRHIEEISKALLTEKIELLNRVEYKNSWDSVYEKTAYPFWITWLLGLGIVFFASFVILAIIAHYKKKLYIHLQSRLNEVQKKYPNVSLKHKIPYTLNNKVSKEIKQLLNRDFSRWEKEEQEIIRKQHQMRIIDQKISELKSLYPNGFDIVRKKHPNYSYSEMVSIENIINLEEIKFQKEKETTRLAELERVKKENDKVKIDLQLLSQATQSGNIELAEVKIKELNSVVKSSTVDVELVKTIEKSEIEFNRKYSEGISDTFDISYVDYMPPSQFVQGENWNYAVAKFPSKGTFVFPFRRRKIARRGFMEIPFHTYLVNNLSKSKLLVLSDCAILPADDYRPYEPDIAIVDIESPSIRIDIEIDEPYAAITNKPIHYIGCGDDIRDMKLNNLGWVVVRFTEYQVKSDMQGCASFIVQLVHSLNQSKSLPEYLWSHKLPKTQKRWTEIESKVMASEKVREKYLNHVFGVVDNEQIEVTDIKQTEKEKSCAKLVKPLIVDSRYLKVKNDINESSFFERDNHIQFFPLEHVYLYNGKEELMPVSSVISSFFKPFDSYYWSERKANERHVPQGQVLEEWDAKGTCSREGGTFMHLQIENYYKGLPYQQQFPFKYRGKYVHIDEVITIEQEYSQFMEFLKNHRFKPFRTEWSIYDEDLKVAGTIDMIHKHGNIFDIYDWKLSHNIIGYMGDPITVDKYGHKGLDELNQIDDTQYWHYCIQQNLYRYILEKNYGIKVEKMYLVVFCDDRNEYSKLDVPYMYETIASIVKACKKRFIRTD
jgi:hypothetical protein